MFSSSKLDSDRKLTQFGKYILITNSNFLQNRTFSHRLSETVPWQEKALSAAALLRHGDNDDYFDVYDFDDGGDLDDSQWNDKHRYQNRNLQII